MLHYICYHILIEQTDVHFYNYVAFVLRMFETYDNDK